MKALNVLSLCDGMSCGQIALKELGIPVNVYYSSEIEKNAIKVTRENFPLTIPLGDVTKINEKVLTALPRIDLVMFGSPCKSLSVLTADRPEYNQGLKGKSKIFFDCMRVLNFIREYNNANVYFLIENVITNKENDIRIMSEMVGVEPVVIDSACFSAQERLRNYWTNIPIAPLPENNTQVLKDILDDFVDSYYYYSEPITDFDSSKRRIGTLGINGHDYIKRVYNIDYKSPTITTCRGGNHQIKVFVDGRVRKLTENEYRKLQTIPEWVQMPVARGQVYNLCGDGWTVKVIEHILQGLKEGCL